MNKLKIFFLTESKSTRGTGLPGSVCLYSSVQKCNSFQIRMLIGSCKKKKKRQLLWHIFDRWRILVCSDVFAALLRSIVRSDSVIYIICDWRHWIFQQNCTSESAVLLWSGAGAKPRMSVVANRYNTRSDCKIVSVVLLFYNSSINKKWTSSNWHFGHGTAKRCLLLLR